MAGVELLLEQRTRIRLRSIELAAVLAYHGGFSRAQFLAEVTEVWEAFVAAQRAQSCVCDGCAEERKSYEPVR
jgi:hypothetical protein